MVSKSILVIGLGEIGYSNAEYMTKRGMTVDGYDINDAAILRAISDGIIRWKAEDFADYDYYIVCVSTHNPTDMLKPDLRGLYDVIYRLAREGKEGALVGIDSTISRGTTRKINEILNHRLHVVHVPHRYYRPERDEHGVAQMRVLGGCEGCCTESAIAFYSGLLGIPVHVVSSVEVAELSKLVENSYRFVEIAFAEELKMMCNSMNIDFGELRNAVNTKWNIKILEALSGIGGHCLPKDSQMLLELSKQLSSTVSIIDAAKKVDEVYKNQLTKRVAAISE